MSEFRPPENCIGSCCVPGKGMLFAASHIDATTSYTGDENHTRSSCSKDRSIISNSLLRSYRITIKINSGSNKNPETSNIGEYYTEVSTHCEGAKIQNNTIVL